MLFAPLISRARTLLKFYPFWALRNLELGHEVTVEGRVWLAGPGRVRIGNGVRLVGVRSAVELHAHEGGEIVLEDGVVVEDGTSIEATRSIRFGAGTKVGPFCKIIDNHFHHAAGPRLERPEPVPISIGRGALVGPRAMMFPGSGLGEGAVLGAATVLSFHLPAGSVFPLPAASGGPT